MPKATSKTFSAEEMEDMTLHGAINEEEAQLHVKRLNDIFDTMASKLNENDEEALGQVIQECKIALSVVMPSLEEAEPQIHHGRNFGPNLHGCSPYDRRKCADAGRNDTTL